MLIPLDRFEQVQYIPTQNTPCLHMSAACTFLGHCADNEADFLWTANVPDTTDPAAHMQVVSAFALSNKNELIRDDYHKLMRAFKALDPEKKGYIAADLFKSLMSSRGEAFSSQETTTMLRYL